MIQTLPDCRLRRISGHCIWGRVEGMPRRGHGSERIRLAPLPPALSRLDYEEGRTFDSA
jgi:hypothetical protein